MTTIEDSAAVLLFGAAFFCIRFNGILFLRFLRRFFADFFALRKLRIFRSTTIATNGHRMEQDPAMSDELVRLMALAIAQAIVDQKGSGATFDIESNDDN